MDEQIAERIRRESALAEQLLDALAAESRKLGFPPNDPQLLPLDELHWRLETDAFSGSRSLVGDWRDAHGHRVGGMIFHADGSFFAEHDIVRTHPGNPRVFVEAVTAWGRDDGIKSEPRLLDMVS